MLRRLAQPSALKRRRNVAFHVAPVPLPAGLPLLALGLGALGLLRRRRAPTRAL